MFLADFSRFLLRERNRFPHPTPWYGCDVTRQKTRKVVNTCRRGEGRQSFRL